MEVRNVKKTFSRHMYNCEVKHPVDGWIPFTASRFSSSKTSKKIFEEIDSGVHGEIGKWEPRTPLVDVLTQKRMKASMTAMEFLLKADEMGILEVIETFLNSENSTPRQRIMFNKAQEFDRLNPVLISIAAELGFSENDLDVVFGISQPIED